MRAGKKSTRYNPELLCFIDELAWRCGRSSLRLTGQIGHTHFSDWVSWVYVEPDIPIIIGLKAQLENRNSLFCFFVLFLRGAGKKRKTVPCKEFISNPDYVEVAFFLRMLSVLVEMCGDGCFFVFFFVCVFSVT